MFPQWNQVQSTTGFTTFGIRAVDSRMRSDGFYIDENRRQVLIEFLGKILDRMDRSIADMKLNRVEDAKMSSAGGESSEEKRLTTDETVKEEKELDPEPEMMEMWEEIEQNPRPQSNSLNSFLEEDENTNNLFMYNKSQLNRRIKIKERREIGVPRNFLQPRPPQAAAMVSTKVQRIVTQTTNLIFRYLQRKTHIQIWLIQHKDLEIRGRIIGFSKHKNLVLDDDKIVRKRKNQIVDDYAEFLDLGFESLQPHVLDDLIWELDSHQVEEPYMELGFRLGLGSNMDVREVSFYSESDSERFEVKATNGETFKGAVDSSSMLLALPEIWLTGGFNLTSHFTLFIDKDVLLESRDENEWVVIELLPSYGQGRDIEGGRYMSLIFGTNLTDIVITGANGTINGVVRSLIVKSPIFSCFGDIALTTSENFEKYLMYVEVEMWNEVSKIRRIMRIEVVLSRKRYEVTRVAFINKFLIDLINIEGVYFHGSSGVSLLYATRILKDIQIKNEEQGRGIEIIENALRAPTFTIASNDGEDATLVIGKLWEPNDQNLGYDAVKGKYIHNPRHLKFHVLAYKYDRTYCGVVDYGKWRLIGDFYVSYNTYDAFVGACIALRSIRKVKSVFSPMFNSEMDFDLYMINRVFFMHVKCGMMNSATVKFEIWDTTGQERCHSLAPMYYSVTALAIIVYYVTNYASFDRAKKWVQELQAQGNPNMVMALIGNYLISLAAEVVKILKSIIVGPPFVGKYDMGAICMQEHSEKLQNLLNDAIDKGAKIVDRGGIENFGEGASNQYCLANIAYMSMKFLLGMLVYLDPKRVFKRGRSLGTRIISTGGNCHGPDIIVESICRAVAGVLDSCL